MKELIRKFIVDHLVEQKSTIALLDNTNLLEEGIIQSVNIFSIIVFIENTFKVKINSRDLVGDNFKSINTIEELVIKKCSERDNSCEE